LKHGHGPGDQSGLFSDRLLPEKTVIPTLHEKLVPDFVDTTRQVGVQLEV